MVFDFRALVQSYNGLEDKQKAVEFQLIGMFGGLHQDTIFVIFK